MKFSKNSAESLVNSCIKTEENVVILKQEIAGLRQHMASFCEVVDRCNNILRQYSALADTNLFHDDQDIVEESQVPILDIIQEPRTSQLKGDADVYAVRIKYFLQHWLGMPFLLTLDETPQERLKKEKTFECYKGILYNHAKSACNHMIKRCENDNVNWQEWTYKNIPVERKLRAYRQLRKFAGIIDIPTYRCDSCWLEKKLIEKFYRHKPRKTIKKNKSSNSGNGKGKEKEGDENQGRQEDDDEQQQQLQEDDEDDLSWDSDLEQLAGHSDEDVEDQLFGEGDEDEGPSSQPPAKRRRDNTFN